MIRVFYFFVTLLLLLLAPWWLLAIALIIGVALFPLYFEAVGIAMVSDILYGTPSVGIFHLGISFSIYAIMLILIFELFLKRFTRFYEQ